MFFHTSAIAQCLALLGVANAAPIVAKRVFGTRFDCPIDGGIDLADGRPPLGPSKIWRGVVAATPLGVLAAFLMGLPPQAGAIVAGCAMTGDCLSSFLKCRLGLGPSSMAFALD